MQHNPLNSYFRRPSIYIKLPSGGKFYPAGTLDMPPNNELAVYPMTAVDEITYRTPDALFNGTAVVEVIKSCVPAIKDPWTIPSIDLDTILSAIRIASYGHTLEIETTCPKCNEEANYGVDLREILEQFVTPDYSKRVSAGDLQVFFKPLSYREINQNSIMQFEEQKLTSILSDAEMEQDEKLKLLSESYSKISELTIIILAQNISYIQTPDSVADNAEHINEFLHNCDRTVYKSIFDHASSFKETTELKPLHLICEHCQHKYKQPFTLNMTTFFG